MHNTPSRLETCRFAVEEDEVSTKVPAAMADAEVLDPGIDSCMLAGDRASMSKGTIELYIYVNLKETNEDV